MALCMDIMLYFILKIRVYRDLARIFIIGCTNWDFKNSGCPKSLIEKVKIITMFMYINIYIMLLF